MTDRSIYVNFDRPVSGRVRLNFLGIPVGDLPSGDEPMPGPEMFGDPTDQEGAD